MVLTMKIQTIGRCLFVAGVVLSAAVASAEDEESKPETFSLAPLAGDKALWMTTDSEFEKVWVKEEEEDDAKKIEGVIIRSSSKDDDEEKADDGAEDVRVFEWLSSARNAARYGGTSSRFQFLGDRFKSKERVAMLGDVPVGETIVRFKEGQVATVEFSIFNRGDKGVMRKEKFEGLLGQVAKFVGERSGGARMEKPRGSAGAARAERREWRGKESFYRLEYSSQRNVDGKSFVAEFIKLKVAPASAGGILAGAAKSKRADRSSLRDRVLKRDEGDVIITTLPMVDQGDKGYCAVASAERVLRYYGIEVDQHELAQIAGSSAAGGTSSEKMKEALEGVGGKLGVRIKTHYEAFDDYREYERLIKRYNRVAKKNPDAEIFELRDGWFWYYETLYRKGDPASLKTAIADGSKYERFKKDVYEHIDAGVPPLWSLFLGVFPEEDIPQPSGGHMRSIIGYNKKTDELIYSDSWGAGHEEKRMPFDEAFTMTLGLRTLEPPR